MVYQIGALLGFARVTGVELRHVKAHGALYNMAAVKRELAKPIAAAVRDVDRTLILFGLPGSCLITEGEAAGLVTAGEAFADRNYMSDGTLVSRRRPDAQVHDASEAVRRAVRMVRDGKVTAVDGTELSMKVDTICIHGDGPHAAEFAQSLRAGFQAAGITVLAVGR
jgi:UPF0271 protein